MNKRTAVSSMEIQMLPNTKHAKINSSENLTNLLDDIQFMDFEEEFTTSEESIDEQQPSTSDTSSCNGSQSQEINNLQACDVMDSPRSANFLDLSTWKRCAVQRCERDKRTGDLIIYGHEDTIKSSPITKLNDDDNDKYGISTALMQCRLKQFWAQCRIEPGDIISIVAVWNNESQSFCVTNTDGLVVVRPDFLVSGTTVVGGLFCMRKAVLQDRFKGIETGMKIMTVGSIVHNLFQIVLRRRLTTREQIKNVSEEMLSDSGVAYALYSSSMNKTEASNEFDCFLDKIYEFMQRYVVGNGPTNPANDKTEQFQGQIESIQDIEENVWVPRFGLKGKIDATVMVKCKNQKQTHTSRLMPLELKTGRSSFSSEHTGQLIIYQMMMSDIQQQQQQHQSPEMKSTIDSGLLLYLRDGVMREIHGTHRERRDLLLLRNEISYYLAKQFESYVTIGQRSRFNDENYDSGTSNEDDLRSELMRIAYIPELPEPIHRANVCATCPYNVLCSVYLNQDVKTMSGLDANHPLREISTLVTVHLTDAHIDYFCHWVGLMALEDQENRKMNPNKILWLETPEYRQKCGRAVYDLILSENVIEEQSGEYIHEFRTDSLDFASFDFVIGNYLIVSTMKRLAIASGIVIGITQNTITLVLERNLCDRYANERFIIDKYESQTNATFNMSNLGALLDNTETSERLRRIVIDRIKPTFVKSLPKIITTSGKSILMSLNGNQRDAILRALTANEYLLLKGLPGTGKTQTLCALIRLLVLMGKSILITSHTHSAVDNLLLRLRKCDEQIDFMRLGSTKRMHPDLRDRSEDSYTSNCTTPDELTSVYNRFNVVGVTCLGSGHPLLTQRTFDVCLVDESTQVFQSTILRPLFSAKKIILVGDPDQLPPIIRSTMAKRLGADESLFARLDSPEATVTLTHQYRMNKTIMKLANDLTYHGKLRCANDTVANATFKLKVCTKSKWIQRILSPHIDQSVIFLNTGNVAERNSQVVDKIVMPHSSSSSSSSDRAALLSPTKIRSTRIYTNYCEVAIILALIKELKTMGLASSMIGIIAPYAMQVELLKQSVTKHFDNDIEVNTVDQYQGRDKEVIIYSCTRSKEPAYAKIKSSVDIRRNNEILEDQRRLTVAITRAKNKLIMIGDTDSLECYRPFKALITSMSRMNRINLVDQQQNFDWRTLLSVFD